ncbi:bromodomain adjacent to zinc finger domain protein 2B isoform X4 [Scleropages formosus]|uniref:bromodomain adjacent to zinc finger domain protein 2B isoform X4 n=1 Tax=Scleropages formosus TaxID=113540 RepID=UPI0008784442|nr:bromodomain adjacent to zinc finger domain protein 2B isoform X4 [Scleropages formosus]
MESGERPPSSVHSTSSAAASSPAPSSKPGLVPVPAALSSPLNTCGHLFRTTNDQPFSMSSVSSAFPMMNHPAFGLYTSSSGRSEFGGLGTLGVSAALAAHSQLGTFPEWWRASEAPGRGTTAFFSPILGLPPMFTPPMQNHDSSPFHSRTPSKNGRGSSKGVNGAVNGSSVNASSGGNPAPAMPPALGASEQPKATNSSSRSRKGVQEGGQIVKEKPSQKTKDKKLRKKTMECSSNSDSESGSSSETSSEGVSSSDSDLDDEDDEEEDDDDDDQSNETDDSDSERDTRVDVGEGKKNMPKLVEDLEHQESTGNLPRGFSTESPAAAHFPIQPSSQPQSLGLVTSSSGPLVFQGPKAREEGVKQHQSVIQATGLAASVKPLALVTQPRQENSPKPLSPSPKPLCLSTSPKPLSLSTSPKPLSLSNSPQPLSLSSSPRPPSLSPSPKVKSLTPSPNPPTLSPDGVKATTRSLVEDSVSHIDFRLKQPFFSQEHLKQVFPVHLKKQQESHKTQKKAVLLSLPPPKLSPEVMDSPKLANPHSNHSNLFLSSTLLGHQHSHHHPNGVIQSTVQDAPLALITKPRSQAKSPSKPSVAAPGAASDAAPVAPFSLPVNLSMGPKNHTAASMAPTRTTTSPSLTTMHIKNRVPKAMTPGKGAPQSHLVQSLVDLFRSTESDIPSSKESDDSVEDEDDEDEDEDDDDDDDDSDSPSESESNFGSDSDGSEDDMKDRNETGTDTEGEKIPLKLTKSTSLQNTSANHSISSSPLNLQVIKTPSMAASSALTGSGSLAYHSAPSSSFTVCTQPGSAKRRRVTDERELRVPLEFGWQRETRIKNVNGRLQGDVAYYAPCGKKLRQYPDVVKYLSRNGITDITRDNFSFSAKIRVGDFYEARDGPQGMQWSLLKEEEVIPRILAMEGRRGRPPNPESQRPIDGSRVRRRKGRPPNVGEEIARQAAQIKLMRKLEKQALARAAKEARKQQAIMAAEEKRKQKEQIKILKQQEKIKRIQQIRMEKELRAQQILEAKRKKKEEAANAKILEAEKRTKEKEMRRQQAVILKHQELERHRLDMVWERERRRQHMMLMKAMEARKKAEERERLKQEKRDEKRLNKERKLELRRLELEMAKELKKPNEDMCLPDHKPLPELSRIPGLVLPGSTFSDCLMVMQFLRSFGKVLGFDVSTDVPSLGVLQEGLLNVGESMGEVQDLLVRMLSAVVCDPGLPPGHRTKTSLGDHLTNVGINRDNVSEILQIYMDAHCAQTELAELAESLRTKAFQAHTPAQKASILAFLVNELACSKSVVSEIDKNIDHMTNLRRDKWVIEGKLRKLRNIHAKKTGKRESGVVGDEAQALGTPVAGRKRKRKGGDSDEDDDEDYDSDDQGEDEEEEEEEGKKGKKLETCEDEDEGDQAASVEELEKQIDKLTKQQSQIRRKLFEASHSLRSMMFGQDRYKRRYWVLPQCGGVFVEGMESGEGPEELQKEKERYRQHESMGTVQIKEEPPEPLEEKPLEISQEVNLLEGESAPEARNEKDSPNLFLQKPGSFSKLSKLLEVAKMSPKSEGQHQKQNGCPVTVTMVMPSPPHTGPQSSLPSSGQPAPIAPGVEPKLDPIPPLIGPHFSSPNQACSPQQSLSSDQLFRVLTEKSGHWFSLLPRSPCDESSLTSIPTPPGASPRSSAARPKSPTSSSPTASTPSASASPHNPGVIGNLALSSLQVKPGIHGVGLGYCGWPGGMSPNMTFSSSSQHPTLGPIYVPGESNGNPFLAPSVSTSKSESPVPPSEKPSSVPSPAVEVAKPQDYQTPQPIPEEMLTGWWRVADMEELRALVKALHSRGIREKALQKQIQKHMEYIAQACAKNRDAATIDMTDLEENQVTEETLEGWCVEEQAMEMDIAILQQVEELERKVTSASLQVKGWIYPEPQSEREDLVYHEHKPRTQLSMAKDKEGSNEQKESEDGNIVRRVNNPLDIAVTRLAELEKNIERRYLKSPLSTTIQIKLDNVGTVTVPAPAPSSSGDGEGGEEDIAPGMKVWRKALSEVRSAAQLALCIQQLQKSIAWERSIMKVYCQFCRKGDNEELLLLCDGCDKGCHTYCHRPKITTIPEGDWFCPACISKASGQSPKNKKLQNRAVVPGKKTTEVKRCRKPSVAGEISEDDAASSSSTPKKVMKDPKKRKVEENPPPNQLKPDSPASMKKTKIRDNDKDLILCSILLSELESHQDAWPFLTPVNPKSVPGYKKVIKKPMDFSTIREKLSSNQYQNLETFIIDVNLVFDNCEKFNEDNSDIGRAGHSMRKFFERRWTELLKTN